MAQENAHESRTLEDRIRAIEDRLEIYNLIAGHPPSADTGADYFTRAVYVGGRRARSRPRQGHGRQRDDRGGHQDAGASGGDRRRA